MLLRTPFAGISRRCASIRVFLSGAFSGLRVEWVGVDADMVTRFILTACGRARHGSSAHGADYTPVCLSSDNREPCPVTFHKESTPVRVSLA